MTTANKHGDTRGMNARSRANLAQFRPPAPEIAPETMTPAAPVFAEQNQLAPVQRAGLILADAAPAAAEVISRIVNGKTRAPVHVQLQAAVAALGANGIGTQFAQSGQQSAVEYAQYAILAKLAAALGRPLPRAPVTIDAAKADDAARR